MNARIRISLSSASVCTSAQQLLAIELDHLAVAADAQPDQRAAAGDMLVSPVNWPAPMRDDHLVAGSSTASALDRAADHHEERHGGVPGFDQHLAARHRADLAE